MFSYKHTSPDIAWILKEQFQIKVSDYLLVLSLNVYLFHCLVYFGLPLLVYVTLQPHTPSCALCSPSVSLLTTPRFKLNIMRVAEPCAVLHLVFGTHDH